VSLAEIKTAVAALSPDELTELAAFIRERDNAAWDEQIKRDVAAGKLDHILREVDEDIRAGRLHEMP
jgi:hypothetical protein